MAVNPNSTASDNPCQTKCVLLSSMDFSDLKDDTYEALRKKLLTTGKGRRPDLPTIVENNKLILQLCLLRDEAGATYAEVHSWLFKIAPTLIISPDRLKNAMQRLWTKAEALRSQGETDFGDFIETPFNPNFISEELESLGLNWDSLMNISPSEFSCIPQHNLKCSVVVQLENFRSMNDLRNQFTSAWAARLTGCDVKESEKHVRKFLKHYALVRRQRSRKPLIFDKFMAGHFLQFTAYCDTPSESVPSVSFLPGTPPPPPLKTSLQPGSTPPPPLKTSDTTSTTTYTQTNVPIKSVVHKFVQTTPPDSEVLRDLKFKVKHLEKENKSKASSMRELKGEIDSLQATKLYYRNSALRKERDERNSVLDKMEESLKDCEVKLQQKEEEIEKLKSEKINLQKNISRLKKERESLVIEVKQERKNYRQIQILTDKEEKVQTRTNKNNMFSLDMRATIMSLVGDAGIAAWKCPQVIDIVSRILFQQTLDLPHWRTANNMVEEAHAIAKIQAGEKILASPVVTLHTDGTSRDKKKFVGQQVTLDNGTTMSLGIREVAAEDAKTLLDVTISVLEELCDVVGDGEDREELFQKMLRNICSTMSDRASVMKCFNNKFSAFRSSELGDVQTNFLHCNAHFLLGLSSSVELALKDVEKDIIENQGQALGRDKSALFRNWGKDEGATCRFIRTSSNCLGPRGDEKNGMREEWLVYCEKERIKSCITSYRSNRFNNFFQNAEAIFVLREDIEKFLSRYTSGTNKKLKSVLMDVEDPNLTVIVCAIALLSIHVTNPYWKLINSDLKYLDLPPYVQLMRQKMKDWIEDPGKMLERDCRGVFNGNFWMHEEIRMNDILTVAQDNRIAVLKILGSCLNKMLDVLERQLADFLETGVFGGEVDEEVRKQLKNCPLTNLVGEHEFGNLDHDIFSRRHTSLFNRSAKLMLRRNKTISWLLQKSDNKKIQILEKGRKLGKVLKAKHKQQEEIVKLKIKERLMDNERKKRESQMREAERKQYIIDRVMKDGGVCTSRRQVEKLTTLDSIKAQIQYHKIIMGHKLLIGGDKNTVKERLLAFIEKGKVGGDSPPRKKRKIAESNSDSSCDDDDSDDDDSDDDSDSGSSSDSDGGVAGGENEISGFKFERQGIWVAVFYDESFFIGQVVDIETSQSAYIKFLKASFCKKDYFVWPATEDIARVDSQYIFKWDFDVVPVSSDGRTWCVPEVSSIMKAYQRIARN